MDISPDRIMATLTVGEFLQLLGGLLDPHSSQPAYVYGIDGISQLFGVSRRTANIYKKTFLQPAIVQQGRKIVVDVEMARALFRDHQYRP